MKEKQDRLEGKWAQTLRLIVRAQYHGMQRAEVCRLKETNHPQWEWGEHFTYNTAQNGFRLFSRPPRIEQLSEEAQELVQRCEEHGMQPVLTVPRKIKKQAYAHLVVQWDPLKLSPSLMRQLEAQRAADKLWRENQIAWEIQALYCIVRTAVWRDATRTFPCTMQMVSSKGGLIHCTSSPTPFEFLHPGWHSRPAMDCLCAPSARLFQTYENLGLQPSLSKVGYDENDEMICSIGITWDKQKTDEILARLELLKS